ncbi:MAG: hypothetical protein IT422_15410 [Pirellulaceae bacterium]|jgi:hypothetical protein|nr:hypothetical protein [Pirellulaceae bacterium]
MKKKKELLAISLILLAFSSGMMLTAATSGCDGQSVADAPSHTSAFNQPDQRSEAPINSN